eukprot:NODE_7204_length_1599_cov_7.591712.p1 GENE.NODE_7204_length_1599_cov_7.591712~~NODE_7204_length_1599_cov_7.591712.p1  ORF type:complete len:445 (+),score=117.44 NODE_7204_length_1599_cov_7.591712:129-1463(+)
MSSDVALLQAHVNQLREHVDVLRNFMRRVEDVASLQLRHLKHVTGASMRSGDVDAGADTTQLQLVLWVNEMTCILMEPRPLVNGGGAASCAGGRSLPVTHGETTPPPNTSSLFLPGMHRKAPASPALSSVVRQTCKVQARFEAEPAGRGDERRYELERERERERARERECKRDHDSCERRRQPAFVSACMPVATGYSLSPVETTASTSSAGCASPKAAGRTPQADSGGCTSPVNRLIASTPLAMTDEDSPVTQVLPLRQWHAAGSRPTYAKPPPNPIGRKTSGSPPASRTPTYNGRTATRSAHTLLRSVDMAMLSSSEDEVLVPPPPRSNCRDSEESESIRARCDGLVMGKGSWASAYMSSRGPRREALKLLCCSGVVTPHELEDDLTIISEEHIDECVHIALQMIEGSPLETWMRLPHEAKRFFEERLTALYTQPDRQPSRST